MSSSYTRELGVLAALLLLPGGAVRAQGWRETSLGGVGVLSRPAFAGAALGIATRDAYRTRLGVAAAVGVEDGAGIAGRLEAMWHFLLDPARRTGSGVYGGAGFALAVSHDGTLRPALQIVVGAENASAGRRGTFIEVGAGRGARIAVGMRWRQRQRPGG